MAYKTINAMKSAILTKVQRKLSLNSQDYTYDANLLGDYFDDAVYIIRDWKRLATDDSILNGIYDVQIQKFIIESINYAGNEGQTYGSANGVSKNFIATPESNLKSSIPQSL